MPRGNTTIAATIATFISASVPAAGGGGIQWQERDNKIIHSTVCFNHEYGSIEYRNCRVEAKKHFKKKCTELSERANGAHHPQRAQYEKQKSKYCYSARNYRII